MTLQFLGAAQTVTGSMHLVSVNGARFLLDCGLFQGKRADSYERNRNFPRGVDESRESAFDEVWEISRMINVGV